MQNVRTLLLISLCFVQLHCGNGGEDTSKLDLVGQSDKSIKEPDIERGSAEKPRDTTFVVDLTQDLVFRKKRDGWTLKTKEAQVTVDKLRAGGVNLVLSAIPVARGEKAFESLLGMLEINEQLILETNGAAEVVQSLDEATKLYGKGVISVMVLLEGADALRGKLDLLPSLKKRGLAVIGLVAGGNNEFADCSAHPKESGGLTEKGIELLEAARVHGIAIDVTHASNKAFWDILVEQTGTVLASHVCARALREHHRNLDDLKIIALSRYGGVMGLLFNPEMLRPESDPKIDINDVVDHVMHVKALGALDALALGTDFDGIKPPIGLEDVSKLPVLTDALIQQGLSNSEIKGVLGDNATRVIGEVQKEIGDVKLTRDEILRPIGIDCDGVIGEFEGSLMASCNGYVLDEGAELEPSSRQKVRIRDMTLAPCKLELFGDPGTPWQIEGQNLEGKVLFNRAVALDEFGRATFSLPQKRNLTRLFCSPMRVSGLREIVVWGH